MLLKAKTRGGLWWVSTGDDAWMRAQREPVESDEVRVKREFQAESVGESASALTVMPLRYHTQNLLMRFQIVSVLPVSPS